MSYLGGGPGKIYLPPPGGSIDLSQMNPATQSQVIAGGLRNRLVNGNGLVSQRGVTVSHPAGSTLYGASDRFYITTVGSVASSTNDWGGPGAYRCGHVNIPAAGNTQLAFGQRIEVRNIFDLAGRTATFSGWYLADFPVTPSFSINTPTAVDNWASANWTKIADLPPSIQAWQYFATTFTVPTAANLGLAVDVYFANVPSGKNVAWCGLQLELGSIATPFEQRPYPLELMLCQRYFQIVYGYARFNAVSSNSIFDSPFYFQNMRTVPTAVMGSETGSNIIVASTIVASLTFNSGRFEIVSNATGDCYLLGRSIQLSAEL